jgi:hypothetical protein
MTEIHLDLIETQPHLCGTMVPELLFARRGSRLFAMQVT